MPRVAVGGVRFPSPTPPTLCALIKTFARVTALIRGAGSDQFGVDRAGHDRRRAILPPISAALPKIGPARCGSTARDSADPSRRARYGQPCIRLALLIVRPRPFSERLEAAQLSPSRVSKTRLRQSLNLGAKAAANLAAPCRDISRKPAFSKP